MDFRIYPYKVGSESVRKLKTALNALIIKTKGSRYRFNPNHVIINWGNSRRPAWMTEEVDDFILNKPEAVAIAANKLSTLDVLEDAGVPVVEFSTDSSFAQEWLSTGHKVYVRHSLTGHSGEGIEVIEPRNNHRDEIVSMSRRLTEIGYQFASDYLLDQLEAPGYIPIPEAPLYTRGVNNHGEYRVHVFDGEVILYQKKSRRVDDDGNVITAEGEHADVRNLASNWIYRTGNLNRLERVEELAIDAVAALGLDFGAVDIIMDENGDVFVLEINSAPGLGNQDTVDAYTEAFNSLIN